MAVLADQLAPSSMSLNEGNSPKGLGRRLLPDSNMFPGFKGETVVTFKKQVEPLSVLKAARHRKEAIGS